MDALRENNIGIALMERHDFSTALGRFQRACILSPQSDIGCLNMGIALLNMQAYDDARTVLSKSAQLDPQNPGVWFNLGLLERATGGASAARDDFQKVAALDPSDADTRYFIGYLASQAQQYDQAISSFQQAIALDPFCASAEYGLAQAEQHLGEVDEARADLVRFQHIAAPRFGRPIRFIYGEDGRYSLAEAMKAPEAKPPAAIPVHFANVTSLSGLPSTPAGAPIVHARPAARQHTGVGRSQQTGGIGPPAETLAQFLGSGACVFDFDGDGRPDIFLVDADGQGNAALFENKGNGKFVDVTKQAKIRFHGPGMGCAVGDYDNDGHPDLVVSSSHSITLFHNQGDGTFQDVTDEAGLRTSASEGVLILGVTFVDYDGDGDLDLYVTQFTDFPIDNLSQPFQFPRDARSPGNVLWRNQGNGKFVDVTEKLGLAGKAPSVGAIATDINNDGTIDLIVPGWDRFPAEFINTREGVFRSANTWALSMPGPAAGAVTLDLDGNGWMDIAFTHWAPPGISVWRNVAGKSFERIPFVAPGWMRGWGIAAVDYDNDGFADLIAVGETFSGDGRIALFRNEGPSERGNFRDVTDASGLDQIALHNPRSVIAFDAEGNGSTYVLITQNRLPPVLLKCLCGSKNGWSRLALSGDPDNKSGLGTRVEILAGALRQTWDVSGASGYLSQGPQEIRAGLGAEHEADVVRLRWPTGLLQDEIQVPAWQRTLLTEGMANDARH